MKMVEGGSEFPTFIGASLSKYENKYHGLSQSYAEGGSNMSMESYENNAEGSLATYMSSVGSNSSHTRMLLPSNENFTLRHSGNHKGRQRNGSSDDALAHALMDSRHPTEGLAKFEEWTLDLRMLKMGPPFAQGAYGQLYRGTYNGGDVAIKILERPENDPEMAKSMEKQFQQEVMMLARLNHPNIVGFIGACRKPSVWCIVTEYAKRGSIRQFLNKRQTGEVPLGLAVKQGLDIARGMAYIHGLGLVHRDLKSDNLLIFSDKTIKIADFGFARIEVKTKGMTPETGTYRWMAPEMIQHRPYTQKVDVYSFGIVLWELVTGMLPFHNMTDVQAALAVVNEGARPIIPNDCLPVLGVIMSRCWDANPELRPPFTEVVKMLEYAENEIMTTVRKARFRFCAAAPMTLD